MKWSVERAKQLATSVWRGTSHGAEYLCVADQAGLYRPAAHLAPVGRKRAVDVTATWLLVGIRPVLIAVPAPLTSERAEIMAAADQAVLTLTEATFGMSATWQGGATDHNWLARLKLQRVAMAELGGQLVSVFEATEGEHKLLTRAGRAAIQSHLQAQRWRHRQKPQRDDPLRPVGNRYEQLRIGYATPRPVLAATIQCDDKRNIFPIDLQGPLGEGGHIVSLRQGAKVAAQIADVGRFAASRIRAEASAEVYGLGRNHMAELRPITENDRKSSLSVTWPDENQPHLLHPLSTTSHLLSVTDVLEVGLHRLHLCTVDARVDHEHPGPTVAHLHLWYAIWLDNTGRSPEYLRR